MTQRPPHIVASRARKARSAVAQLVLLAMLCGAALWLLGNVQSNLQARNIASGFSFLSEPAGFAIGETSIAYRPADSFGRALVVGLINTLKVSVLAIIGATLLGSGLGLARLSGNPLLRGGARIYVEFVRNVPLLLHLLLLYAALLAVLPTFADAWRPLEGVLLSNRGLAIPALSGAAAIVAALTTAGLAAYAARRSTRLVQASVVLSAAALTLIVLSPDFAITTPRMGRFNIEGGWQLSTELLTLVCGLALYTAAYIAEIVRAGILSVPVGQREAAVSLGLTRAQSLRHVILPQSLRAILPPLASWHLNTVKNSSLAVVVAYPDLVSVVDTIINQTGQAVEGVAIIVAAFLTINLLIAGAVNAWNARLVRIGAASGPLATMGSGAAGKRPDLAARVRGWLASSGGAPRTITMLLLIVLLAMAAWRVFDWLVLSAVYDGGAAACRMADGACWPFIAENYRLILFGAYPLDEQWRASLVLIVFAALLAVSFVRRFWHGGLIAGWVGGIFLSLVLMKGGVVGMTSVPTDKWSGLPLTVVLASVAVLGALPIAILLALGRRSRAFLARVVSTGFIELVRGIPLIAVLFMAALMFPLLLPGSFEVDSFVRVQIALVLFTAAYMAESVRAGLQALPNGQIEAATSLGLSYIQSLRRVVLPQALRTSIPGLVNTAISEVKNTTLVLIVGMFDLLQTTRLALVDVQWRPYFVEAYGFTAVVFFVICFVISQLSRRFERSLGAERAPVRMKEIA